MKKLARAIVRMRRLILIAAVLLLIPAAVGAVATPINYDIQADLPEPPAAPAAGGDMGGMGGMY